MTCGNDTIATRALEALETGGNDHHDQRRILQTIAQVYHTKGAQKYVSDPEFKRRLDQHIERLMPLEFDLMATGYRVMHVYQKSRHMPSVIEVAIAEIILSMEEDDTISMCVDVLLPKDGGCVTKSMRKIRLEAAGLLALSRRWKPVCDTSLRQVLLATLLLSAYNKGQDNRLGDIVLGRIPEWRALHDFVTLPLLPVLIGLDDGLPSDIDVIVSSSLHVKSLVSTFGVEQCKQLMTRCVMHGCDLEEWLKLACMILDCLHN